MLLCVAVKFSGSGIGFLLSWHLPHQQMWPATMPAKPSGKLWMVIAKAVLRPMRKRSFCFREPASIASALGATSRIFGTWDHQFEKFGNGNVCWEPHENAFFEQLLKVPKLNHRTKTRGSVLWEPVPPPVPRRLLLRWAQFQPHFPVSLTSVVLNCQNSTGRTGDFQHTHVLKI